jgi:hypothetical protein
MNKRSLNRQVALSTLCGLCFALLLNFILIERITPWVLLPSLPGLIASALTVGVPWCGDGPTAGSPIHVLFPYVGMWFNAIFYSVATFVASHLWMDTRSNLRVSRRLTLQYRHQRDFAPRTIGALLDYEQSTCRGTADTKVTRDYIT